MKQRGGKVIASGGFGCIFEPALKCIDSTAEQPNKISKLTTTNYADEEYSQIQQFRSILQKIPHYQRYFLLDNISLCKPAKLSTKDLQNFNKKCKAKALTKKHIRRANINKSLKNLAIITMPHGGVTVTKFVKSHFVSSELIKLNNSLIDLLVNGIIPMNKLNVYHGDIKADNVLVQQETQLLPRLIDWGLSFVYKNSSTVQGIPKKLYRRPFQINVPFSSILFNKVFTEQYDAFLQTNPSPTFYQIREFVVTYMATWNKIRGPGHLERIKLLFNQLTKPDTNTKTNTKTIKKTKSKEPYYYIVDYLTHILMKYTNKGQLDIMDYFNNIFLKNLDIWGFIMVYRAFYDKVNKQITKNENQLLFLNKMKYIILHFLYESPTNVIDVNLLKTELTSLNELIAHFHK
jgi:tRNA A-37 threonylcarbamoyl transferase component Bud32